MNALHPQKAPQEGIETTSSVEETSEVFEIYSDMLEGKISVEQAQKKLAQHRADLPLLKRLLLSAMK